MKPIWILTYEKGEVQEYKLKLGKFYLMMLTCKNGVVHNMPLWLTPIEKIELDNINYSLSICGKPVSEVQKYLISLLY
jgi:hypothetical protein